MKILAFLESPSEAVFPPGQLPPQYKDDQDYHRKMLKESMSGRRLWQAFGTEFESIWWDNVDPDRNGIPDQKHLCRVIDKFNPDIILTFGVMATMAIDDCVAAIRVKTMSCHHPNARFKTQSELDSFAAEVHAWCLKRTRDTDVFGKDNPEDRDE